MDKLIDFALKTFIESQPHLFGQGSEYLDYEIDNRNPPSTVASNVQFIRVKCGQNDQLSSSLVLKTTSHSSPFAAIQVPLFKNESFFYARVVPFFQKYGNFESTVPRFYNAHIEMNQIMENGVILLQNLQDIGYRPYSNDTLDYQHAALAMQKLGAFHAYSFVAQQNDFGAYCTEANGLSDVLHHLSLDWLDILEQNLRHTANVVRDDPLYASRMSNLDEILDNLEVALHRCLRLDREEPTLVIRHGDVSSSNFLFLYENGSPTDCKMVDWSQAAFSYLTLDLSCFLYMSLDQKMRDDHWQTLMDDYYRSLSQTFPSSTLPTKVTIEEDLRRRGLYFGLMAMFYKPYLMARKHSKAETIADESLEKILDVGDSYHMEVKVAILKDMIDRDFMNFQQT